MSYLSELRKSKEKHQVAFTEFASSTRNRSSHLFCFFEGKDNDYYVPRIKRYTNDYYTINCNGREKVLKVYELIVAKTEYQKYKKAFFIDRDFNPPLSLTEPPIFETPCYSIENLYVSQSVFREILTNLFGLSATNDKNYSICLNLCQNLQAQFHEAVLLFNAWYACLIDIKNETGQQTGVNLGDKLPNEYIKIGLDKVEKTYDLEKIKTDFPNAVIVDEERLNLKITEFSNCEQHYVFRGKYELQFIIELIRAILTDGRNERKFVSERINFVLGDASSVKNEVALNLFSAYAETPENLHEYLDAVTR